MSIFEFTHLDCQSEYSVKNSLIRIPKLIKKAKKLGMNSVALTDECNLFATLKLYKEAIANNIKPVFGAKIKIKDKDAEYKTTLLCQNYEGYLNLSKLISLAYLEGQELNGAYVTKEQLVEHNQGLIMIALPIYSDIAISLLGNQIQLAKEEAKYWLDVFTDRYYLAVQRTGREFDEKHLHLTIELGLELGIAIVATNDVQFLKKTDFEAHEARICISQGGLLDDDQREKNYTDQQYLKSADEMGELFFDLPELLTNSVQITKRCNVHFELNKKNYLPDFPVPKGLTIKQFFTSEAQKGLDRHLQNKDVDSAVYKERLQFELGVIIKMKFFGYFLIVADFIRWSRQNDIPVGPGRGSGAGSLVAYALGITNVDPIKHELLFERFLNPERVSMPDFDIDFCTKRRDEVIEYVAKKYGREKVSQIITYGKMAAKGVVRDAGRVLGHPYGFSDKISKSIPNDLKINLSRALGRFEDKDKSEDKDKWFSPELKARYDSEEAVTALIDLSLELEGLVRNVGTHAGGVLIAPSKVSDFCPVYKGENESDAVVSQFDMKDVEALGLVKFDFLGLSNLTVIDNTLKIIASKDLSTKPIDLDSLNLDDKSVFELLQKCDTTGVFQLESQGMRGYLKKMQPDSFDDIIAMLALYRPGPLDSGMVDDYIDVKHGRKRAKYPHPLLKEILKPTNGVFVYQEQVMKSAQILADYSLGEADLLRRAMGKKIKSEMDKQRSIFVKGAKKKDINEKKANDIFDLIDKFSGYGFNKSHSVAYAYISYQTAWLKAHYPAAFMASVLSAMMGDTDRIAFTISEIRQTGLIVNRADVCSSNYEFSIKDDKTIIYGLGAIKGVGEAFVKALMLEREKNGNYKDLFDFCYRIEKKYLNRRAIEALIYSGGFDVFGVNIASLIKTYPIAVKQAEQRQLDDSSGQGGLFTNVEASEEYESKYNYCQDFSFKERLQLEKSVIGYYFSDHPTDEYKADLKHIYATLPNDIIFRNNKEVRILALISELRYRNTKKGDQMANVIIEDGKKKLETTIFAKTLGSVSDKLIIDDVVVVSGKVSKYNDIWQVTVDKIESIDKVRAEYAKGFKVSLTAKHQSILPKIADILSKHKGRCPVRVSYANNDLQGSILLGRDFAIRPSQDLFEAVDNLAQEKISKICY